MRYIPIMLALMALPQCATSQAAIERHAWQDARTFETYSRTASRVTGKITLSGNDQFATKGSRMRLTFENGKTVELVSVGASWRQWNYGSQERQTAETFVMTSDPGPLENGNELCGNPEPGENRYAVFYESYGLGSPIMSMNVYQSIEPPTDSNSEGGCGTYNYSLR